VKLGALRVFAAAIGRQRPLNFQPGVFDDILLVNYDTVYHLRIMNGSSEPASAKITHRNEDWLDRAALGASALCLVHCLALPLLFAALPALSAIFALPESIHFWILLFAVPSSALALFGGRARHGASYPIVLGLAGLACLAAGALIFAGTRWDTIVTVPGGLLLAMAHATNWRLRHAHHRHG